jgi:hypothetical protein
MASETSKLGINGGPPDVEAGLMKLHRCFDTWRGIGEIVAGMARQDYDLELRLQRPRLARDALPQWFRALTHCGCRQRVGTESMGGGTARSW